MESDRLSILKSVKNIGVPENITSEARVKIKPQKVIGAFGRDFMIDCQLEENTHKCVGIMQNARMRERVTSNGLEANGSVTDRCIGKLSGPRDEFTTGIGNRV